MLSVSPTVQAAVAAVGLLLCLSSVCVWALASAFPGTDFGELKQRTRSWWVMIAVLGLSVLLGRGATVAIFGLVSFLALKEYLSLIPLREEDRPFLLLDYGSVALQAALIATQQVDLFLILLPLYALIVIPASMAFAGVTRGFLAAASARVFGVLLTVYLLGHVPLLMALPEAANPVASPLGLGIYLVFLAQFNDVMQYVTGRLFGRRQVIPSVSPGKTWEGLVGGFAATVPLAGLLAEWLTPFSPLQGAIAGGFIALAGFAGDVLLSAIKRDLGVKDTSRMFPGHGGMLDRVDSLIFSAPIIFLLVHTAHV